MGQTAFDDVSGERQGDVTACRITPQGDVLRLESDLTDKILVCRNSIYDRSREWVLAF